MQNFFGQQKIAPSSARSETEYIKVRFTHKNAEEDRHKIRFRAQKSPLEDTRGEIGSSVTLVERIAGVEPVTSAWEANVLPINYIRKYGFCNI